MDKPDSVTIPIDDELWDHIRDVCGPGDVDELVEFIQDSIRAARHPYDYDSPRE